MLASECFFQKTGRRFLYNISPLNNMPSVIQHGILCSDEVQRFPHESIALPSVQERRSKVIVTEGRSLHQYANLYFDYHNPMLSRRRDQNNRICILAIDYRAIDIRGCVLTDRNAATEIVRFFDPMTGIGAIDFEKVYAKYWTHPEDEYEERNHRAIKCAEILIPHHVPYEYILDALVFSEEAKEKLEQFGFSKMIYVRPDCFF